MKRLLSLVMAVAICFGAFSLPEILTKADAALDFKCGENATWYLDTQTGTLTISGTGSTYDYESFGGKPFSEFSRSITSVVFEEGITRIGSYFTSELSNCVSIALPSTLKHIDYNYFSNSVSQIIIPENNSLIYFDDYFTLSKTKWFQNQPDGVVYLGNCVMGYRGTATEDETVTLRENTVSIAPNAFYNQTNLKNIIIPETVEFVGYRAFDNTAFLADQPIGALYIGKALYRYVGSVTIEDYEFNIKEGTVCVSSEAFSGKKIIKSVHFPESVRYICRNAFWNSSVKALSFEEGSELKYIGKSAFGICQLNSFDTPEGLEYIDDLAFSNNGVPVLKIPSSVNKIGKLYGTGSTNIDLRTKYEVSPENRYYSSDEYGILYNKDKTVLIRASVQSGLTDFTVPDSVVEIAPGAFRYLTYSYRSIHLPDGLKKIGQEAFACMAYDNSYAERHIDFGYSEPEISGSAFAKDGYLSSVTVRSMDLTFPEGALSSVTNENFTVYLMRGSAMQTYCDTYGINYEFLDYTLQLSTINDLLSIAGGLDRSLYAPAGLALLDETVSEIDLNLKNLTQEQVDEWANEINYALSSLEYLPADYAAVGEALARARGIDRSLYTADSLLALDSLVLSIDYNANITRQAEIDSLAADINSAVDALVYREADYSPVNTAVSKALAVNQNEFTESSFANLQAALQNVVYGLDITQQRRVNAFADSIELAIDALIPRAADYKDVYEAVNRAAKIDREYYTAESLARLDAAVGAVDYSLNFDDQQIVTEYARAINSAVDSLEYLPADYSEVDRAIALYNNIDRLLWRASSLTALDQYVSSVDRSLNITQQTAVNACAQTIIDRINSLEYAAVTLRNDTHEVIVGASAKEIYPTTSLTVEKLDPSNIASANFAVGGKVKTALYYDISLIRNSVKIQPDGTVTVKIRIPDGVAPEKCKVYHVTDDPVDPLVKFTSSLDGSYIVFETDHFSEFAVLEVETVPVGIVITSPPSKTVYAKGEAFDPNGMEITAFYSNGASAAVTDYDISVDMNTAGAKTLTVYYTFNGVTKSVSTVITVEDKPSPSEPANPLGKDIILKAPSDTRVEYGAKVTVTVSAENLPEGCYTVIMMDGKAVARGRELVSYNAGSLRSTASFTAKIIDPSGKTAENSSGKPLTSNFTVEVNGGIFARIIAFFKSIFGLLPETELKG